MQWTNLYNLPAPLVEAIKNDPYEKVGDISVTGLNQPPQMRQLKIRHDSEIVEDVADHIWRFFGQMGHSLLERVETKNLLAEERLTEMVEGVILSGKLDLYNPATQTLTDFKFTSVYAFLLGEKPEWTRQLNFYRWLLEKAGFPVKHIQITAILRDWSRRKAKYDSEYPPAQTLTLDLPLWPMEKTEAEIIRLVRAHQSAAGLPDDMLPECSPEERWEKPTTYAVKKTAESVKAYRVFEDRDVADSLAKEKGMTIEVRPGENTRCEDFCPVKQFCAQYARSKERAKAA